MSANIFLKRFNYYFILFHFVDVLFSLFKLSLLCTVPSIFSFYTTPLTESSERAFTVNRC